MSRLEKTEIIDPIDELSWTRYADQIFYNILIKKGLGDLRTFAQLGGIGNRADFPFPSRILRISVFRSISPSSRLHKSDIHSMQWNIKSNIAQCSRFCTGIEDCRDIIFIKELRDLVVWLEVRQF